MADYLGPPPLPGPVRAALGLVASIAEALRDGRGVPDKVLELPVLAVGTALQFSLRAQQRYAAMMVRGDEVLALLRGEPASDPPSWAKFDDDPPPAEPATSAEKPPATKASARKAPAKKVLAPKAAARKTAAKTSPRSALPLPRAGKPSAFDLIGGEEA